MADLYGWVDEIQDFGIPPSPTRMIPFYLSPEDQHLNDLIAEVIIWGEPLAYMRRRVGVIVAAANREPEPPTIRWSLNARAGLRPPRRAACRYCGLDVVLGKRGWRLDIPTVRAQHCEDAPRGYHGVDKQKEIEGGCLARPAPLEGC